MATSEHLDGLSVLKFASSADASRGHSALKTLTASSRPIEDKEGRPVVLEALSGSHNYNLNTPTSDRDYKVFVAPTFSDLYRGSTIHREWIGIERDVLVHDVRKIPELLWKSNPSFLKILFSGEVVIPDTFAAPYIERIYGMRDEIARMNLPYLYDGMMGIARGKFGNMLKGTSGTADLVARFGYDTKQAMHCVRSMEVLERFAENGFSDFGEAIWFDGEGRERMLSIKNGSYALERFERAEKLRDAYKAFEPDIGTKEELDLLVMELVRDGISEEFGQVVRGGYEQDVRARGDDLRRHPIPSSFVPHPLAIPEAVWSGPSISAAIPSRVVSHRDAIPT